MASDLGKKAAAEAALTYIQRERVVGVGTGSTVNHFIELLTAYRTRITGTVSSSEATTRRLRSCGLPVFDLNAVDSVSVYIDGADEVNRHLQLIKGGGGALTREKILAAVSERFVCIADAGKRVTALGGFPLPIEVIPMARSYVAREVVRLGGQPTLREGFTTDNGNIILDATGLDLAEPIKLERNLNDLAGVVCAGVFAMRPADLLLAGSEHGVETLKAA